MEVIVQPDAARAASLAAAYVARAIRRRSDLVLGLATGGTMCGFYRELVRLHREGRADFARVTTFNLDEYIGLAPDHPGSFRRFMQEQLFAHVNLHACRTHVPDGLAADVPAHCREYEALIHAHGGIDIQVLGIGTDGHIGFNEPISSLASRTRSKTLAPQTRRDNAAAFGGVSHVPTECITMGIGTILDSRTCLLLAFGEGKAEAVAAAVEGPVAAINPASALQLHRDTKVFLDPAAASRLRLRGYYEEAFAREPDWRELD